MNNVDDDKKSRTPSKTVIFVLLVAAAYVAVVLIGPFLNVVAFSLVTVILFRPLYVFYERWLKGRQGLALLLTIVTIVIGVLIPVWFMLRMTVWQAHQLAADISDWSVSGHASLENLLDTVNQALGKLPFVDFELTGEFITQTLSGWVASFGTWLARQIVSLSSSLMVSIVNIFIYLMILSTLFPGWPRLLEMIKALSPLPDDLDEMYINRISLSTAGMVRLGLTSMVLQALTMTIWLAIAGAPYLFFWFLLCMILAALPIGCSLVAFPVGIYLLLTGQTWQGLVVILGYILITANVTPILSGVLFPKGAQVDKALVLLSVFGGLVLFGLLGLCYGPLLMVFCVTTVHIALQQVGFESQPAGEVTQ
jgi:predicted PurR-regulated permease PerM